MKKTNAKLTPLAEEGGMKPDDEKEVLRSTGGMGGKRDSSDSLNGVNGNGGENRGLSPDFADFARRVFA